ncbi:MAG: hypothetical protein H6718_33035 [Polyangiaceae bacterium]|nr:hypothetical protein [Polyangiaceae bacterium]MCB9605061.1 hypothetical protein [Polyangiaceae bacterium]
MKLGLLRTPIARFWPALLASLALLSAGCAEERAPINQVQPNALAKSFFIGEDLAKPADDPEFYWRNFVVDASESQELIGIGSWSGVDRIRWEITETQLIARKAYGISEGGDDKGQATNGTIVAIYPIDKHFDITRAYNPSTGEELNVLEENTSDRPWNERQFFRVDWSMNQVETPQWNDMFVGKVFGDLELTSIAYYVSDPESPDAPHFDTDEGYFDVTSKFWVAPATTDSPFSDLSGKVPSCLVLGITTGNAVNNCDPQEAVIRSSYWRVDQVDPDQDFEPFENNQAALDIVSNPGGIGDSFSVGTVTPPRIEWDPQYGYTDAGMHRYMNIHNIWQQSHQTRGSCESNADCQGGGECLASGACSVPCTYDARGDNDHNGTDDQCENAATGYSGSSGSQCSSRNRCTIPYRDREVAPVAYWVNPETPAGLLDEVGADGKVSKQGATEDLIYSWNQMFEQAVAHAREVECRNTGAGDRQSCGDQYFAAGEIDMIGYGGWGVPKVKEMPDVLVLCHNPVRNYDPETCGAVGKTARVGDVRKNFLFYWPYESKAPWGGIANWNADPLTGQIIGASATTMGRSATFAAARARDIIMVANGELDVTDITDGVPAELFQKRLRDGRLPASYSEAELAERVDSIDAAHAASEIAPKLDTADLAKSVRERHEMIKQSKAGLAPSSTAALEMDAILGNLRGSQIEAQLLDPSWMVDSVGISPNAQVSDAALEMASPLRGSDYGSVEQLLQRVDLGMQARGVCFEDAIGSGVGNLDTQGVARYFKQKYSDEALMNGFEDLGPNASPEALSKRRGELIYNDLWVDTYKGIALHEIGHSLGMLHQFASSYDSVNYNPQYWQLRTQEGAAAKSCAGQPRAGDVYSAAADDCMGPRYLDPETDDELGQGAESRPGINYFANTSTMEYQNERFFESVGLGQYDRHMVGALYGRVLETFDADAPDGLKQDEQASFASRHWSQLPDENLVYFESEFGLFVQSMHYTEQARRIKLFDPSRCREATDEEKRHAEWRIVHGKVCMPAPRDHAAWRDFQDGPAVEGDYMSPKVRVDANVGAAAGNVRWPYRWGVSSNSYVHTNPSDAGADVYEATLETIRKFESSYVFNYFRAGNRNWYYQRLPSRTASSFFERLRATHWSIANTNARYASFGEATFQQIASSDDWWRPYIMAERAMFDAIARALLMPQPGEYRSAGIPAGSQGAVFDLVDFSSFPKAFDIDASSGRYIDPDYNSDPDGGGSWQYQEWPNRAGFTVEKADAAKALTDSRPVLFTIARENYLDGRNTNVNFRSDMPLAVDRLIGGVLAGDWESVGLYVPNGETGVVDPVSTDLSAEEPVRPTSAKVVAPNLGYKQQLGVLTWAYSFARLGTDLALTNKLRVWIKGQLGEAEIPDSQQIRFYNPESGLTYVARLFGPDRVVGRDIDSGIASRMLRTANTLLGRAYQTEPEGGASDGSEEPTFGMPKLVLDADGFPIVKSQNALLELRRYIGLLDAAVQIANLVGYGPLDGVPHDFE